MKILLSALLLFSASSTFAVTFTYECNYQSFSDEEGNHPVASRFTISFLVDNDTGKAYVLGNNGSNEVIYLENPFGSISFIEVTDSKNVMTTTISPVGKSVHSRNSAVLMELVPSQYYGQCDLK